MSESLGAIPHDDLARWRSGKLALAAATTHTTAESHDQPQPAATGDGRLAAVFDGYLLNHEELAAFYVPVFIKGQKEGEIRKDQSAEDIFQSYMIFMIGLKKCLRDWVVRNGVT